MGFSAYATAWRRVLGFYFTYAFKFGRIHADLPSGLLFSRIDTEPKPMKLVLGAAFQREFNEAYRQLKTDLAGAFVTPNYECMMIGCFIVRAFQCAVVWSLGWAWGLSAGLLQFLVAPLSLTGSFIRLLTNFSDAVIHYLLNCLVVIMIARCEPLSHIGSFLPKLAMDGKFIIVFFSLDFALNLFVYFSTGERWTVCRLCKHILYGTFNTKTYFVVVFGCLFGLHFDLLIISVTSLLFYCLQRFGLQKKLLHLLGWPCFPIAFYVEHRIGHIPIVYQHAHKMHHYLHDTTAFDAHVYGSGMNEEFFWILAEVLPCLAWPNMVFPYYLNVVTLWSSWTNKGGHTRTADGTEPGTFGSFDEDNWHADHHTFHRANFGSATGILLDFYFGSQAPGCKGGMGLSYDAAPDPEDASRIIMTIDQGNGSLGAPRLPEGQADAMTEEARFAQETKASSTPSLSTGGWENTVISVKELSVKKSVEAGGIWVALHGAVFDLTVFHRVHPGGAEVLLMYAGTDATPTFDEIGHSDKAKEMSKKRIIGLLDGQSPSGFVAEMLRESRQTAANVESGSNLQAPLLAKA